MTDAHEAKRATPHALLLAELLDSRIPKSEREHAAKREIDRLTAERDELRRQLAEAGKSIARQAATIRNLTRPAEES